MSIPVGSILENRYRVENLLGQGGMGAVYRAWDLRLAQWVALKENTLVTQEAQAQFEQEARVLARLHHASLPRVIDHFVTAQGLQYLVMDYIEGSNLAEIQARRGPLPAIEVTQWLKQVCDALNYLHTQNPPVIHRDIKPQNIKITPDGRAVLVDFGLSKIGTQQQKTATGALGVTPGFSPPEQYGAAHTDERSDIYALAATVYALFTGETPPDSVQRAIQSASLRPPRLLNPNLSQGMENALLRGLETQPSRRPPNVRAFQSELEAALRGSPADLAPPVIAKPLKTASEPKAATARPPSAPRPKTVPPQRRNIPTWAWFAGGTGAALVLLLLAILLLRGSDGKTKPTVVVTAPDNQPGARVAGMATSTLAPTPTTDVIESEQSTGSSSVSGSVSKTTATPKPVGRITVLQTPTPEPQHTPTSQVSPPKHPATSKPPTETPIRQPTNTAATSPTNTPKPAPQLTPCPPYLHRPKKGMGLLLIENHLGAPLHIDRVGTDQKWDLPPKEGDNPARLVLDLLPGTHEFIDNTPSGYGHIRLNVEVGKAYISPIWYNDLSEELVYPLDIPNGCR